MTSHFKPILVNRYEEATFDEVQRVVDMLGLNVWLKVRVADVLPIERQRPPEELFSYALKSHFDFVVYRNLLPEYAVEFDGSSHSQSRQLLNDHKKNLLCKFYGFPILRIDSRHIEPKYQKMTLLAWIMEVRETEIAFNAAQEKGLIPLDEPFDPKFIWSIGDRQHPFWLSRDIRYNWESLQKRDLIWDRISSGGYWYDDRDTMHGIEFIRVTADSGIHVASWMRLQDFPEMPTLFEEILLFKLHEQIKRYLARQRQLEPLEAIYAKMKLFDAQYTKGSYHSFSRGNGEIM